MSDIIWGCKIGGPGNFEDLPPGSDAPLRQAVQVAYHELTGRWAEFTFSGWNASLNPAQQAVVDEDRLADPDR